MNRDELVRLLALGEGRSLEFKTRVEPRACGEVVCAFLNSGGGFLILGVADRGEVVGVPGSQRIERLESALTEGIVPKALVSVEEHVLEDNRVWVVEVPAGHDFPYGFRDVIWVREADKIRRADIDTIRDLVLRRQIEPERWERRFSDADPGSDLDLPEIRSSLLRPHASPLGPLHPGVADPLDALGRLGLSKHGRLTNGGDVLFASRPSARHPQVRLQAVRYTGRSTDATYRDLQTFEGPLSRVLEQAFAFVQGNTPVSVRFPANGLAREEHGLYPMDAIREGLVNALAHRDYADFRGGVTVHIHPDRLEIWNSGDLPEGITPELLGQGQLSVLRNPDIAHVLYLRGLMEKLGRGGSLIRTSCERHGLPAPRWTNPAGRGVTLTFFAPEVAPEVTPEVAPEVTPEVRAILRILDGELARRDLQNKLSLKDPDHFREHYLQPALESGYVEMTLPDKPNSRLQRYRLTGKGQKARKGGKP